MKVYDHLHPQFKNRKRRTNGAVTYSINIVRFQARNWAEHIGPSGILLTAPKAAKVGVRSRGPIVQYLHEYPYEDAVQYARKASPSTSTRFIVAYRDYAEELRAAGLDAKFVPMAINIDSVRECASDQPKTRDFLYFGNIIGAKKEPYYRLMHDLEKRGIKCDRISADKFNGQYRVSHTEALEIVSQYRYVFAVGRCALEAYALGCKVLIYGRQFGGIVATAKDADEQAATNFNSRKFTFSDDLDTCLEALPSSLSHISDITKMNHATDVY